VRFRRVRNIEVFMVVGVRGFWDEVWGCWGLVV